MYSIDSIREMEEHNLTEAAGTDSKLQTAPTEAHGKGVSVEEIPDSQVITESTMADDEPRQNGDAGTPSCSQATAIRGPGDGSDTLAANGNPAAEISAALSHLMRVIQEISTADGSLVLTGDHASPTYLARKAENVIDSAEDDRPADTQSQLTFSSQRDDIPLVKVHDPDRTGWPAMAKTVRGYDEEEIGYYKDDIDTLLVFAGLYSAALTAFITESYKFLQPDNEDKMVFLFQNMLSQNYTTSNGFLNATNPYPKLPDFEAPTWAVRVNLLWFSSLVISLAVASYGMLVKQWLREYLNTSGTTSPRERLRARQYRRPALDRWMVFEIAASLPLLLEIALGLFFVGLCYFTAAIHSSISQPTIQLVAAWGFFFLVATIAPLISPRCPYKTTILRAFLRQGRRAVLTLATTGVLSYYALLRTNASLWARFPSSTIIDGGKFCYVVLRACGASVREHFLGCTRTFIFCPIRALLSEISLPHVTAIIPDPEIRVLLTSLHDHMEEEKMILKRRQDDIAILSSVEEIMQGDGLLPTMVDIASSTDAAWSETLALVQTIVYNRIGQPLDVWSPQQCQRDVEHLAKQVCEALVTWTTNIMAHHPAPAHTLEREDLSQCFTLLCSLIISHNLHLPKLPEKALYDLVFSCHADFAPSLFHANTFTDQLKQVLTDFGLKEQRMRLTHAECASGVENLISCCDRITYADGNVHDWITNAFILLISHYRKTQSWRPASPFPTSIILKLIYTLCDNGGHVHGLGNSKVDVFYGLLLGGATSDGKLAWKFPSRLCSRSLTSICRLEEDQPYHRAEVEDPASPKTAFLTLMKCYTETWTATLLGSGWLAPGRMPGNILAEIVAADLAACEPIDQRRKLDDLIYICRITALEISPPDSYSMDDGIDLSTLLQIGVLLETRRILDGDLLTEKVRAVQAAFRTAVICRHVAYRALINTKLHHEKYEDAIRLIDRMRKQRVNLVHAMRYQYVGDTGVDIFYRFLLGAATSRRKQRQLEYSRKLSTRDIMGVCQISERHAYCWGGNRVPPSPQKAFITMMKSYSETWTTTLLGWLAPGRMPGNILAEIVAADLATCDPNDQRRKLDEIIHVCQIASLEICPPSSNSGGSRIDFSSLLQIIILLQRDGVIDPDVLDEKIRVIQNAFGTAVIGRHTAYRALINYKLRREGYYEADKLVEGMGEQRIDLVYAMSFGCYRESGWAGVVNQRIRQSDWGRGAWEMGSSVGRLRLLVDDAFSQQERSCCVRSPRQFGQSSIPSVDPDESDSIYHLHRVDD